jgi:acyl-coenzyme A synthetase/AMP-(fatty) acid ligase
MENIPRPVKIAALAAGASYVALNELENRFALLSDVKLLRKLSGYRQQAVKCFAENRTIVDFWYDTLSQVGPSKKSLIMCEDDGSTRTFTFGEVEAYSNRVANFLIKQGLKTGETIALLMENRPEFIGTWLGASKVGVQVAMINTSIVKKGLAHCINVSNSKVVVYGAELEEALKEIVGDLNGVAKLFCQGASPTIGGAIQFDDAIKGQAPTLANQGKEYRKDLQFGSVWGYIYTSVSGRKCFLSED